MEEKLKGYEPPKGERLSGTIPVAEVKSAPAEEDSAPTERRNKKREKVREVDSSDTGSLVIPLFMGFAGIGVAVLIGYTIVSTVGSVMKTMPGNTTGSSAFTSDLMTFGTTTNFMFVVLIAPVVYIAFKVFGALFRRTNWG